MCVCLCVDNEGKLPRPSTPGKQIRVSNVTRVLSDPLPIVNTQEDMCSPPFVCEGVCSGGVSGVGQWEGFLFIAILQKRCGT